MYEFEVNPGMVLALVAGGLALVFDWFPPVKKWFDTLSESQKRWTNVGVIFAVAVVLFVGDCYSLFVTNLECSVKGALDFVYALFFAIAINQGVHFGTKPAKGGVKADYVGPVG